MAGKTRKQMKLTQGNGIIAVIPGMSLQMENTWRRWTLLILMGSKEDTLQSTLNKGDPMWDAAKLFSMGWCLGTPLWYDLVDFWRAREGKCLLVLSILESLKEGRRLQWGLFFVGSLLCPKKDKSIHRRAHSSCRGWETSLLLVVQSGRKSLNLYWLDGHSDTFTSMNKTKFARQYFLDEKDGKELNDNPWWDFL